MTDLSQLTIQQSDATAKVIGSSGRVLAIYSSTNPVTSNKPAKGNSSGGVYTPPAAQLQDGQLVVVTQGPRGVKMTRTYALSPERTQLYVSTKLENPRFSKPVMIRLVYDQTKSSSAN